MAPVAMQAIFDAIKFNQALLNSGVLKDTKDHEEYLMSLELLLSHVENEYKKVEKEIGLPLSRFIQGKSEST